MRLFSAVGLIILGCVGATAQRRAGASAPVVSIQRAAPPIVVPSAGALGGRFASVGISRPLGGVAPPSFPSAGNVRRPPQTKGYRYVGPVYYTPNVYDSGYQSSGYSTFDQPANPALYREGYERQPQQPPTVVNQYFGSRRSNTTQTEGGTSTTTSDTAPGDPIGTPQNYYLIAYKDHSVYSALAYWLEGDTLHYVTTQNTHNQASLALIDLEQTTKLNADSSVPFSLAGR